MIFTEDYLKQEVLYGGNIYLFSLPTCKFIKEIYPDKLHLYQKMLKKQFNFDTSDPLYTAFDYVYEEELALLRVLLLQSFEQAILNGEIK